eukprot:226263_1
MWSCHKNRISTKKATWNIAALIELSHHSLSDVLSAGYAQSVLTEFIHSLGDPYWLFSILLYMNCFVLWTFLEYWQHNKENGFSLITHEWLLSYYTENLAAQQGEVLSVEVDCRGVVG